MIAGLSGKGFTPEGCRPHKTKRIHQWFAAGACVFTEGPAGGPRRPHHTLRGVDGAQEGLEVRGAAHFNQRKKLIHLQAGIVLRGVAQEVRQHSLRVGKASAQRDGDLLT